MAAIGMALLWISYTLILYGLCLFRDYQITLLDLVVPGRWKGGWPPPDSAGAGAGTGGDPNAAAGALGGGAAAVGGAVGQALQPPKGPGSGRRIPR